MKFVCAIYEDDGPMCLCGQSCSTTSPGKKLFIFNTEEKMRELIRIVESDTRRKNSRITKIFYPDDVLIVEE